MGGPWHSESRFQREYGYYLVEEVGKGRITRRQLVRRASVFGISVSSVGLLLAACGGDDEPAGEAAPAGTGAATATAPAEGEPKTGGVVRVGMTVPPSTFEPVTMYDASSVACVQQVNEYLAAVTADYELVPELAVSWEPDEAVKAWTFTLREGVTFNDGSPLAADDVVATFDLLTDPAQKSQALSNFSGLLSNGNVEKVDDLTVRFHLDRPFADFPYFAGGANTNALILKRGYRGDWSESPIGTGPFTMTAYQPKRGATFARNETYWGDPTYLDGVEVIFYADSQAQALALQGGEIDVMLGSDISLYDNPDLQLAEHPGAQWNAVHMRTDQEPWTDNRVRQALCWSIDREAVVRGVLGGRGVVGNDHMFAPVYPVSVDVEQRVQDQDRARQLLADAGVASPQVVLWAERTGSTPNYAVLIQEMASAVGFEVEVKVVDQPTWYGSGDNQPWLEESFGITGWANRPLPSQTYTAGWTCDAIWNSPHWCNEEFDSVLAEYDATVEEGARSELANRLATICHEESPYLVSYHTNVLQSAQTFVKDLDARRGLNLRKVWLDT